MATHTRSKPDPLSLRGWAHADSGSDVLLRGPPPLLLDPDVVGGGVVVVVAVFRHNAFWGGYPLAKDRSVCGVCVFVPSSSASRQMQIQPRLFLNVRSSASADANYSRHFSR